DGVIQGMLEFLGYPYTGSTVMASAMALDKSVSKEIFEYHRISTPSFEIVDRSWLSRPERQVFIKPPMVIKPVNGGSTIGISIVKEEADIERGVIEALKWSEKAVLERFVDGTLVAVGILKQQPLPVVEIVPKSGFYDYQAKYSEGRTTYYAPARISEEKAKECQTAALEAHRALRCSGATRADFIIDGDGKPFLLEVNTIPGMTEKSLLPMAAMCAGVKFLGLVEEILIEALKKYADGKVLGEKKE
ncbi:MAG: D-alanine--D-alanine ligase, partial [Nitrospinota bacterium]